MTLLCLSFQFTQYRWQNIFLIRQVRNELLCFIIILITSEIANPFPCLCYCNKTRSTSVVAQLSLNAKSEWLFRVFCAEFES